MIINWNDIINNGTFIVKQKLNLGSSNNKFIIEVANQKYLLARPKVVDFKLINYRNLGWIFQKLNSEYFIRKTIYTHENFTQIYQYLPNYKTIDQVKCEELLLVEVIKKLQKLTVAAEEINWLNVAQKYYEIAQKLDFNFSLEEKKIIQQELQQISKINIIDEVVFAHGDLTSENILVEPVTKDIKIIDFEYCCLTYKCWDIVYYCYYNNWTKKQGIKFLNLFYTHDQTQNYEKVIKIIELISLLWAAQDFAKTKNQSSLKQYKTQIKKYQNKEKICMM